MFVIENLNTTAYTCNPMSVSVRLTPREHKSIRTLVEKGVFMNPTDFTRTAIRELLLKISPIEESARGELSG